MKASHPKIVKFLGDTTFKQSSDFNQSGLKQAIFPDWEK